MKIEIDMIGEGQGCKRRIAFYKKFRDYNTYALVKTFRMDFYDDGSTNIRIVNSSVTNGYFNTYDGTRLFCSNLRDD